MEATEKDDIFQKALVQEIIFTFTRSGGPGGQHVNKVSSRAELKFNLNDSDVLTSEQKSQIQQKLGNRITKDGFIILSSQEERSQVKNKQIVIDRFLKLIEDALKPVKKRVPSKPPSSSVTKRLEDKKKISELKRTRKKPLDDNS